MNLRAWQLAWPLAEIDEATVSLDLLVRYLAERRKLEPLRPDTDGQGRPPAKVVGCAGSDLVITRIGRHLGAEKDRDVDTVEPDDEARGDRRGRREVQPGDLRCEGIGALLRDLLALVVFAVRDRDRVRVFGPRGRGAPDVLVTLREVEQHAELRIGPMAGFVDRASLRPPVLLAERLGLVERVLGDLGGGGYRRDEDRRGPDPPRMQHRPAPQASPHEHYLHRILIPTLRDREWTMNVREVDLRVRRRARPASSMADSDRGDKFAAYRRLRSLREYVLVSQRARRIDVYRRDVRRWHLDEYGAGEALKLELVVDEVYADALGPIVV